MKRTTLRIVGFLFWAGVVIAAYAATNSSRQSASESSRVSLVQYFAGPTDHVVALDPTGRLRQHDPIFFQADDGSWSQIGYVQTASETAGDSVALSWYSREVSPDQCRLRFYRNSGRLEDVVATMLPPEKRLQIQQRLAATMSAHGDELSAAFVPLVQETLRQSLPVIEEEFRLAVNQRRADLHRLGQRWNDEVVEERLIPLAKQEIMPIVREHGEPPAERIGRELWDRASIWRFGWRAVYDRSPLPRKDLVQEEWDRFVDEEAVPVFESHMDDIVAAVQRIVTDVAANEAVRDELADVAARIATDKETRQLVRDILKETLIDNERLRIVWNEVWSSDQARDALDMAGDRLEPVVRQIGDDLFGTREEGINPDFARVLRSQILGKDRRWIVAQKIAEASADQSLTSIEVATDRIPYPIVYMADAIDPEGSVE